jgi:hypothetical protein
MPSATATMAYPGYARARKKLENNARRAGKPGMAPIMRAFSFLVRVVLATVLLPLDLLLGDAVRTGDMTRPFTGAFGIAVAYGAFRAAEFAVGLGRASSNADDDETKRALFRFRVRPPATLDPCRLQGVPFLSKSSVCAYKGTVVNVVVEPFEITNLYDDKTKLSVDVVDLDVGFATARAFRVDGVVRAAADLSAKKHSDVASFPYAAPLVVSIILNWRPQLAHGSKGTRVLLIGGGGGNAATYAALERACAARAETRHRRAERGEGSCDVTLIETNEEIASALRFGFEGFHRSSPGVLGSRRGEKKTTETGNAFGGRVALPSPEGAKNRFAIVAGDAFSFLRDARPGSLDVIVFDARRDVEASVRAFGDGVDGVGDRDTSSVSGENEDSEFSDASRAASVYRDARRALRAGGTVISVASAPFIGPGRGGADLAVLADAMRDAFDDVTKNKGKASSVRFERVGPAVPGFAQETLVLATKTADAELAARFNYN